MKPLISIIVPVFNVEPFLGDCLDSLLAQTLGDFEVILVNDGSTDNSINICNSYAESDNRIKVIDKEYGGVSSARNAGLKLAKGDYIGFVDGDDYILKNMYLELYELCEKTESDISISKLGREINGEIINKSHDPFVKEMDNIEAMRELFKGILYRFSLCNKLFKRKCFENIQFPDGRIHEDLSTTYKLFANSDKAVYTNNIGYIYVKRENSILTSKFNEKRLDAFIGWDEILAFMIKRYPELSQEFLTCYVFGCVDNIFYILNQVNNKRDQKHYIRYLQQHVKKYFRQIINNDFISLKYKSLLTLLNYNFSILVFLNNLKNL
ncbi:glycosyltransferase family 2 protein [Neobacillus sp. M.A.Huq-85]